MADWPRLLMQQIRGAIAGGVTLIQVRERGLDDREYLRWLRECVAEARATSARVVVNDRVDLALASGAHGVHLRELSVSIGAARALGGRNFLVGRSVHDASTAARCQDADYLIAGSVFGTASHPERDTSLGVEGLQQIVQAAGKCPVFAVGGITVGHMPAVRRAGPRGIAAIDAFLPPPGSRDIERDVHQATAALQPLLIDEVEGLT